MKSQQAIENFKTMNCAQSVLTAFAPDFRLDEKTAIRIAAGFGSGMGEGDTCGAVTGAYMVIGMKIRGEGKTLQELKAEVKASVKRFNALFQEKCGSIYCRNLLGVDLATPEGVDLAKKRNLFDTVCPQLVGTAVEILESNF
jgi:C_GCAxxG_C_C family probable redox protein